MSSVQNQREDLVRHFYPNGMPNLWCPTLTHVCEDGTFDARRMEKQMAGVADFSSGWMVFGPAGHGEQFSDDEVLSLLEMASRTAARHKAFVLAGICGTDFDEALERATRIIGWVRDAARQAESTEPGDQQNSLINDLTASSVMGIALCPPVDGGSNPETKSTLRTFLKLGVPTAICQLPTTPENLMPPDTIASLASEFPNFVLFEDASGQDRVVMSSADLANVQTLRGAQGNYLPWTKAMGGKYDGLMAGATNGFAMQLYEMLGFLEEGFASHAVNVITPIQRVIDEAISAVSGLPFGNSFANSQHAIDYFLAHGRNPKARAVVHGGHELPEQTLERVRTALDENGFLRTTGYMA